MPQNQNIELMAFKDFDKEDEKILRAYCDALPIVLENTHEVHRMKGSELLEMGYVLKTGDVIVPEKEYLYDMPVQIAVNHYRRLKIAWLKHKEAGVADYINGIAKLIKADAELNKTS